MLFFRSQIIFDFEYIIFGDKLKNINYIKDFGVIFQENLTFSSHID